MSSERRLTPFRLTKSLLSYFKTEDRHPKLVKFYKAKVEWMEDYRVIAGIPSIFD